jgi:hypothetical protein
MTDSIYKIYKKFYQRSYRNPEDEELKLISTTIHDVIKDLYNNQDNIKKYNSIKKNSLIIAEELRNKEIATNPRILITDELISALKSKIIELDIPYQVIHQWNAEEKNGLIYILTSEERVGECKLGATTMTMEDRIYHYELRYGYSVTKYFSKKIKSPFQIELLVANKMKYCRVAGNTFGESNEWYKCDTKEMKLQITQAISDYLNS